MITNAESGTNVHEIANGIYRINTPVSMPGGEGQFNFNQYLITDDMPMLFHTGPRRLFPFVRYAISRVMPVETLRYIAKPVGNGKLSDRSGRSRRVSSGPNRE